MKASIVVSTAVLLVGAEAFALTPHAAPVLVSPRSSTIVCRKFEPKEGWKVREGTKADDKSWGILEWAAKNLGGSSEAVDMGPRSNRNRRTKTDIPTDDSGNWNGDRRVFSNQKKKTVNDGGIKFNPLDASTW